MILSRGVFRELWREDIGKRVQVEIDACFEIRAAAV